GSVHRKAGFRKESEGTDPGGFLEQARALGEIFQERPLVRLVGGDRNVLGSLLDAELTNAVLPLRHARAVVLTQLLGPRGHALAGLQIDVDRLALERERDLLRIEHVK